MDKDIEFINRRLDQLLESDPHLAQPVAYYRALAALLAGAAPLAPGPELDLSTRRACLSVGQPLLGAFAPAFPRGPAGDFFRRVCAVVAPYQAGAAQAVQALEDGRLDLPALLSALVTGDLPTLEAAADRAEVAGLTLRVLLEYTLRPTLREWANQLLSGVSLDSWQQPTCPVCANPPLMAELYKAQKLRILRCGICGASWPFPIARCVHCGNADPATQGLLVSDDDNRTLIQTCKRCNTYLKTVITTETLPHDLLSLEDLATLHLDQGCQQKGYTRFHSGA